MSSVGSSTRVNNAAFIVASKLIDSCARVMAGTLLDRSSDEINDIDRPKQKLGQPQDNPDKNCRMPRLKMEENYTVLTSAGVDCILSLKEQSNFYQQIFKVKCDFSIYTACCD